MRLIIGDSPVKTLEKPAHAHTVHGAATIEPTLSHTLRGLIARTRPRNIVETGTHNGLVVTLTLCEALVDNAITLDHVYSIESNPAHYAQACERLAERGFRPHLLCGSPLPGQNGAEQSAGPHVDDLLGYVLRAFNGTPDLVLLDASTPTSFAELTYALSLIRARCYIAIKGPSHGSQCRCLALLQDDSRFQVLELSTHQDNFCLAQFDPA